MEKGITATSMNETYRVGEEINEKIKEVLISGMKKGDLRDDIKIMPAIFQFWGMLSGLCKNKSDCHYFSMTTESRL